MPQQHLCDEKSDIFRRHSNVKLLTLIGETDYCLNLWGAGITTRCQYRIYSHVTAFVLVSGGRSIPDFYLSISIKINSQSIHYAEGSISESYIFNDWIIISYV